MNETAQGYEVSRAKTHRTIRMIAIVSSILLLLTGRFDESYVWRPAAARLS
jgi:hypothetical protein